MSIFLEDAEGYEREQETHFHEPDFDMTGNDGEYEHDDDGIPSFVDADDPDDKAQKFAMGEFSSIFLNEDLSDVNRYNSTSHKNKKDAEKDRNTVMRNQPGISKYGNSARGTMKAANRINNDITKRNIQQAKDKAILRKEVKKAKAEGKVLEAVTLELEAMEML